MHEYLEPVAGLSAELYSAKFGEQVSRHIFKVIFKETGPFILKLIDPSCRALAEQAEDVANWLNCHDVPVISATGAQVLSDGTVVLKMPYFEGHRVSATSQGLYKFGQELAKLHQVLAEAPSQKDWEKRTKDRLDELSTMRTYLVEKGAYFGPDPKRLLDLAHDKSLDFTIGVSPVQPLHGDLNPGNVLVVDGQVIFMDFEDTLHSVLPLEYEIMLVIERFVLVRSSKDYEATDLGREFLRGYFSKQKIDAFNHDRSPVEILRALALRSLIVLAYGEKVGVSIPDDEWEKFFYLEEKACSRANVIQSIFEGQ
ncbi:phosphotransferase enzyme family protein [Thalassospira australica]|uniref:phosphotransferase enzyme family protein n=1 Tax=Thalassospira australica TaxID=1528106 RepID=UPI000519F99E|nr:phosphotransferase [Thalassospira australica]